ncbi:predicted protein, partial [Naegleria gruberi]
SDQYVTRKDDKKRPRNEKTGSLETLEDLVEKSFVMKSKFDHKGKFTPNFYPNRFKLKDEIYFQYPEVLTLLLMHTLIEYANNNVEYVEYSISVKDLKNHYDCLQPGKVKELFKIFKDDYNLIFTKCDTIDFKDDKLIIDLNEIKYYFLGAFNRGKTSFYPNDVITGSQKFNYMISKSGEAWCRAFQPESYNDIRNQISAENFLSSLNMNCVRTIGSVVGFDWVGDELLYPFCAFVLNEFTILAKKYEENTQTKLGLRYHCGENIIVDHEQDAKYFLVHMEISYRTIRQLVASKTFNIRLGHGVGFLLKSTNYAFSSELTKKVLNKMEEHAGNLKEVTFEWCPTSNEYLLFDFHDIYLPNGFSNLVVATDNDGIMDVGGVAKETEKAANYLLSIGYDNDLNEIVEKLKQNAIGSRFIPVTDIAKHE